MTEDYWTWGVRCLYAFQAAIGFGAAGALLMGVVDGTALEWPGFVVFVALIAFGIWRGLTIKVTADSKRIVVRNLLATHVIRRADILRIRDRDANTRNNSGTVPTIYERGRRRPVKVMAMLALANRKKPRFEAAVKRWGSR